MLARLLSTEDSRVLTVLRLALGLVMLPHGAQKLLGLFGGYGFAGTMGYFTGTLHIPAPLALLVILSESLGSVGLLLGLGTRVAAFGAAATMLGAIFMTHLPHGFFMNWFGNQAGEGVEFHLLAIGLALPLIVKGAGAWALDGTLARRLGQRGQADIAPRLRASKPLSARS